MKYLPKGNASWMGKDEYILLSDRYDVWKFSPDGRKAVNLTKGEGRREKVCYSVTRFESQNDPFLYQNIFTYPLKGTIDLIAFDEEDSRNGFATINAASASTRRPSFMRSLSESSQERQARRHKPTQREISGIRWTSTQADRPCLANRGSLP